MPIRRKKISDYPAGGSLVGLWTLGYSLADGIRSTFRVSLEFLKTSADNANNAAINANNKAQAANSAASSANQAAGNANTQASAANSAAQGANSAATLAGQTASEARQTIDRLEGLEQALVGEYKVMPGRMILDYPRRITIGNPLPKKIDFTLLPVDTGRNVIFVRDETSDPAVAVDLTTGELKVRTPGVSRINVTPTENTTLCQTVEITVRRPTMRLTSLGKIRLTSGGKIRMA